MDTDVQVCARIPADVEAPDRILWGLTARQVAIVAAAAAASYTLFKLGSRVLAPVLMVLLLIPLMGVAVAVALGRRDGLSADMWILAAIRHRRVPRRAVPAPDGAAPAPGWAPDVAEATVPVLRLPAQAINQAGVIDLGSGSAAVLVAAGSVNVALRTGGEQAGLVAGYARWLNSLTGPVQVVVSARRVDLTHHAQRVAHAAAGLAHPALAAAAGDYSDFLLDVAARHDPLARTVTVACTAHSTALGVAGVEAMRRAEHTAAALAALGTRTQVLDGPTATAVLAAAVDPDQPVNTGWPRALTQQPVTGPHLQQEDRP